MAVVAAVHAEEDLSAPELPELLAELLLLVDGPDGGRGGLGGRAPADGGRLRLGLDLRLQLDAGLLVVVAEPRGTGCDGMLVSGLG